VRWDSIGASGEEQHANPSWTTASDGKHLGAAQVPGYLFPPPALGERGHRGLARRLIAVCRFSLKGELKQDSPPNNYGTCYQNGLMKTQNFAATNCGIAVSGVQCAPNLNDALLKVIEDEPAGANS
jgi:hypothetical protein